jgi:hypothetical protein
MVTLVFNVVPVMFVTQINIVLRSFLLSSSVQSAWMGQVVLSGHSSLVLLLGLMSIFVSCGAYTVNHCVVARGPFQTALLFLYFVLTAHVATSDAPGLLVLQCVASMAMGVYVAIVPVYFARMMNVLLFTLAFATTCTGILRFEGVTAACAPLFVVGSGFLVGVILFYIVRLVIRRNCSDVQTVFNLAFTGQTTRAKQLLEALDSQALIEANPRLAVQLAFQLNAKTLADLLRHLDRVKFCEVYQLHFVYSCTSYYATIVNVLPDLYSYLVQERFDELKVLEKEFWRLVWLSHIPSMSKLACALGRRRYEFSSMVECVADRFGLQYAPDPKENGAVEHRLIFWCYFVSLLCCMLAQIILWLAAHEQEQELGGHELIVQFVGNVSYAIVETRLIRNDTTISANTRFLFQVLQSEESNSMINGFLGFEMSGQTIAESFVDFMNCLPSAKFCGNLPFVDMVTIARANQSLYYSPSYMINQASFQIGFVLSQVLVLVTCVAIVVHMFLVDRRSITQEFKKFIAIPKSVLLRILHCQPPIDSLNTFPVGRQYYIWDILPAAIAFYATFLAAALANVCQCFSLRSWLVEDITSKTSAIQLYGQMQNVQLLLASVYEGSISESWPWRISEFSRLDLYV